MEEASVDISIGRPREAPTVSVVLPTRNRAAYLEAAVTTVLSQSHHDLELIVVDDASTDETPELLDALRAEDRRMRVIRREERGGAPRARNAGAAIADGRLLAFLDDDCTWHPRKLEKQLASMKTEQKVAYTRQATKDVDGRWIVEGRAVPPDTPLDALLRTNFIGAPSLVVDRRLFEEVAGFDEELPRLQDWDLALRLARDTSFCFVPEVLVQSVIVPGGISSTTEALPRAAERILARHANHLTRSQRAALHYGLGKFLLVDGHAAKAREHFRRSVHLDPANPINWVGVVAGLLGPAPARLARSFRRRIRAGVDPDIEADLHHSSPPWDR